MFNSSRPYCIHIHLNNMIILISGFTCADPDVCSDLTSVLLPHDDFHKFIHCDKGDCYEYDCPAGLEFDVTTNRCELPDMAGNYKH